MSNGFTINECDKCVYVKDTNNGYVIVCLYVDDMLILGSNNYIITTTKKMLSSKFNMKDLVVADVILGIKISRTSGGLYYLNHIILRNYLTSSTKMKATLLEHQLI